MLAVEKVLGDIASHDVSAAEVGGRKQRAKGHRTAARGAEDVWAPAPVAFEGALLSRDVEAP